MTPIKIIKTDPFFFEEQHVPMITLPKEIYLDRIDRLTARMRKDNIDQVLIWGDREHFANIEYFSTYDCRFEEGLLVINKNGGRAIIVGNEGWDYTLQIPYEIDRHLYRGFSLQGQVRTTIDTLTEILTSLGISKESRIGVVGYKYFLEGECPDPLHTYDVPHYLMQLLFELGDEKKIQNYTTALTGLPDGIRMRLYSATEVAWVEARAVKVARVLQNMLKNLKEGITEVDLARSGKIDFTPVSMFGLTNFGPKNVKIGLRSGDDTVLQVGEVIGTCYAIRGSLCSRNGVAAYDEASYAEHLKPHLFSFYGEYWRAIATWYESVKVNAKAKEVYDNIMDIIGDERFNVFLNPGHNTATDEWVNSPFYPDSPLTIPSGSHFQCDMIATNSDPTMSAICEDTVIVADEKLRKQIKTEYPDLYRRIVRRQQKMRELLGIQIDDSLLPLSNFNGAYFPFMVNAKRMFSKK
jgi:hypothetical protein